MYPHQSPFVPTWHPTGGWRSCVIDLEVLRIVSLLFVEHLLWLPSLVDDIQNALKCFTAECEVAKMKISTLKSGAIVQRHPPLF